MLAIERRKEGQQTKCRPLEIDSSRRLKKETSSGLLLAGNWIFFLRILFVKPPRNRLSEEHHSREQFRKHERDEHDCECKFFRERCQVRDHGWTPAKTSRPFSKP